MTPKSPRFFDSHLIAFIFLSLALCVPAALAGWSEDVQLTYRGYEILPQVIARNDTIHVAWQQVAGPHYVSYMRSTNGGVNWDSLVNLTEPGHRGVDIGLSQSGNRTLIGWFDVDTNPINWVVNFGFSTSTYGESWSQADYVFQQWRDEGWSEVACCMTGDSVYFASWGFTDSSGYQPLYFVMSPDLGQTWSQLRVIAYSDQFLNNLRIQKCEGVLYAAWSAVPYPNGTMFEAVAIISPDGGQSWSDPIQLSSADAWPAQHTCIACEQESGNAVIGWVDSGESHSFPGDLYLRITSDGGASWGNEIRATHHHKVANPSLAFAGDSLWVVWSDWDSQYGPLNFEICFSKSIDLGLSWTPYERLTYAEGYSYTPWISYDVGNLHLVWEDQRPSSQYSDIYYKSWHYQVGVLDIGSSSAPMALSVFPNPFNTAVTVAISSYIQGQLVIYDLLGNRVRTFPVNSGKHRVVWEGRGQDGKILASGVYIACLRGGDRMITTKLVMIR